MEKCCVSDVRLTQCFCRVLLEMRVSEGRPDQTETRYESLCHHIGFKNIFLDYERPKISVCVI